MLSLKQFITNQLDDYIIDNDSYKDIDGKGFVQRYLGVFGDELDEFYYGQIDKIIDQTNPLNVVDVAMLDLIAAGLGDLPNISKDSEHYRRILSFIISIWKIKGTIKSYKAILYTLGLTDIVITELPAAALTYDDGVTLYDDGVSFYDSNCKACSEYEITANGPALDGSFDDTFDDTFSEGVLGKILDLIALVEPINAKLIKLTYNGVEIALGGTFDDSFDDTFF